MIRSPVFAETEAGADRAGTRRSGPRVPIRRRALLRGGDGRLVQTVAYDLSMGGIGLRCDPVTAYLLDFDGRSHLGERGPVLEVRVALPFPGELVELRARCRMFYRARTAAGVLAVGLRFVDLDAENADHLEAFLRSASGQPITPLPAVHVATR